MLVLHVIDREYQNLDSYVSRGRPFNIDLLKDQKTEPVQFSGRPIASDGVRLSALGLIIYSLLQWQGRQSEGSVVAETSRSFPYLFRLESAFPIFF